MNGKSLDFQQKRQALHDPRKTKPSENIKVQLSIEQGFITRGRRSPILFRHTAANPE